eukprot:GHRQ01024902.1.p1 GENE.GHRQ01024902.1~~GHRQ01024902.1.p1  ORF type:complete len:295 (-),score=11.31 GHRQ01024902.1:452-1336(-)
MYLLQLPSCSCSHSASRHVVCTLGTFSLFVKAWESGICGTVTTMAAAASSQQQPVLTYWDRNPPFAAVALAQHANLALQHAADPKATNKTTATLKFPSGWGPALLPLHPCTAWFNVVQNVQRSGPKEATACLEADGKMLNLLLLTHPHHLLSASNRREELVGAPIIVKFLTRLGAQNGSNLYGPTPLSACQVGVSSTACCYDLQDRLYNIAPGLLAFKICVMASTSTKLLLVQAAPPVVSSSDVHTGRTSVAAAWQNVTAIVTASLLLVRRLTSGSRRRCSSCQGSSLRRCAAA